jgi:hypothetical protein
MVSSAQVSGARAGFRDLAILVGLVLIETLPVAGKAFHIDDAFFIAVARNVERHPLRPFDGAVALDDTDQRVFAKGGASPNTFETLSHPPLVSYVLAAVSRVAGGYWEVPEHVAFLPFALLAVGAQYHLARRFTRRPLAATLLLATSAIFVVSAQGVMTDVPALALFLAALALFVAGVDADETAPLLLAGLAAGLAFLTRYVALGLVPLGAAYVLAQPPPRRARRALVALVPLAALTALWLAQNRMEHGEIHLAASARHYLDYYEGRYFAAADLARRGVTDLAALGATAFPLAVVLLWRGDGAARRWRFPGCVAAALLVAGANPLGLVELDGCGAAGRAAVVLCLATGLFLIAEAAARARGGGPDGAFLLFWLMAGLAGTVCLLPFGAARYMLPVVAPLALLLARDRDGTRSWMSTGGFRFALALTSALSLILAAADYEYAGLYRDIARRLPAVTGDRPVFFIGDWGFRFYMEGAGHRYLLSSDESPVAGDFVVRPQVAGLHEMAPGLARRAQLVTTIVAAGTIPVRLMSHEARAGFYSHGWGLLPFTVSSAPLERFDVYRVTS